MSPAQKIRSVANIIRFWRERAPQTRLRRRAQAWDSQLTPPTATKKSEHASAKACPLKAPCVEGVGITATILAPRHNVPIGAAGRRTTVQSVRDRRAGRSREAQGPVDAGDDAQGEIDVIADPFRKRVTLLRIERRAIDGDTEL